MKKHCKIKSSNNTLWKKIHIWNVPNVHYAKIFIDLLKQVNGKDSLCMTKLFSEIL